MLCDILTGEFRTSFLRWGYISFHFYNLCVSLIPTLFSFHWHSLHWNFLFILGQGNYLCLKLSSWRWTLESRYTGLSLCSTLSSWSWSLVTAKWISLTFNSLLFSFSCCLFAHNNQKYQKVLSEPKLSDIVRDNSHSMSQFYTEGMMNFFKWLTQGQLAGQEQRWTRTQRSFSFSEAPLCVMWVYDRTNFCLIL